MGKKSYLSNYFMEALDLSQSEQQESSIESTQITDSSETKRMIWTVLDTSIDTVGEFGMEVISFEDYQLIADFTTTKPQIQSNKDV